MIGPELTVTECDRNSLDINRSILVKDHLLMAGDLEARSSDLTESVLSTRSSFIPFLDVVMEHR